MSQRRCCCTDNGNPATVCPESLPSPVAGCSTPKWRVSCSAAGMTGIQYGTGQHTYSDGGCYDCQKGTCGLTALHEGSVDNPDPIAEGQCISSASITESCQKYAAGKAKVPMVDGHHVLEFINGDLSGSNITYEDQADCVYIEQINRCDTFRGCSTSTQTGIFSTVFVTFLFDHTYNGWSLNPNPVDGGECSWTQVPIHVQQSWTCTYQRRLMANQYVAQGTYKLVNVVAPIAGWVYDSDAGCHDGYCEPRFFPNEHCASNYFSNVDYQGIGFPWQPPVYLTVIRIC